MMHCGGTNLASTSLPPLLRTFVIALVFLLPFDSVWAKTPIIILFGDGYPPFYWNDAQTGMYIDLLDAFQTKHPQFEITKEVLSRKRLDDWMISGKAHAMSLTNLDFVPDEVKQSYLPSETIWTSSDVIVSHQLAPLTSAEIGSLIGKKLGTIYGNHYNQLESHFADNTIMEVETYKIEDLYSLLVNKRVDGIVVNKHTIPFDVERFGFDSEQFYVNEFPLYYFALNTLVKKDSPGFYQLFNQFIKESKKNGVIKNIEKKYQFTEE